MTGNLFNFCDLLCKYAETPKEEGIDGFRELPYLRSPLLHKKEISCSQERAIRARSDQEPVKSEKLEVI